MNFTTQNLHLLQSFSRNKMVGGIQFSDKPKCPSCGRNRPDSFRGRNRLRREHKRPGSAIRRDAKLSPQRKNTFGRENFSLQKDAANVSCISFANCTFYWPFIGLAHFGYARTVADLMRNWATYNYPEECFSLFSILWHSCFNIFNCWNT